MKRKVIIEETVSQEFEVDIDDSIQAYEQVRAMYRDKRLVVDNPVLVQANVMICSEDGEETDWNDLHVE